MSRSWNHCRVESMYSSVMGISEKKRRIIIEGRMQHLILPFMGTRWVFP
jgi:hypothetical protein